MKVLNKFFFALALFCGLSAGANAQTTRYVRETASGSGDGSSWANASNNLQAMINASHAGDQVWVATGTYKPCYTAANFNQFSNTYPTTDGGRDNAFILKDSISVFGGFPNTGNPAFADRDWEMHTTTLSGDIGNVGDDSDNVRHVVLIVRTKSCTLDGFVIRDGKGTQNAEGQTLQPDVNEIEYYHPAVGAVGHGITITNSGAGIHCAAGHGVTLKNLLVTENHNSNYVARAVGVDIDGSYSANVIDTDLDSVVYSVDESIANKVVMENVTISNNVGYSIGGMSINQIQGTFDNVVVDNNTSTSRCSGMLIARSNVVFNNSAITNNTATEHTGGVWVRDPEYGNSFLTCSAVFNNCNISNNTSLTGHAGGVYVNGGANLANSVNAVFNNCIINNNSASSMAGGMMLWGGNNLSVEINNTEITNNTAPAGGGILCYSNANPVITNTLIAGNTAPNGGGLYVYGNSTPILTNVTITGNTGTAGSGIYNNNSSPSIANSIIYGNTTGIFNGGTSTPVYTNSLVQDATVGGGIVSNSDPLFVDATDGNYRLQIASSCVDAGGAAEYLAARNISDFTEETDLAGNARHKGSNIDIGAYEFQPVCEAVIDTVLCFGTTYTDNYFSENESGTYEVTVIKSSGCDSIITLNLTVRPQIPATQRSATICYGGDYTEFPFNITNAIANQTYSETLQSVNLCDSTITLNLTVRPQISATQRSATICYGGDYTEFPFNITNATANQTYSETLQSVNLCDSTITLNLTVNPQINTAVTLGSTALSATQTGATYQWLDCSNGNAPISGATAQSFTPSASGNYAVEITLNGCTETSECVPFIKTGIDNISANNNLLIYPNPVTDELKIENIEIGIENVEIVDISGRAVVNIPFFQKMEYLNVSHLPAGVYLVKIGNQTARFVKK